MYLYGPVIFGGFVNFKIEAVRGQIFTGKGAGVLGEGTRKLVRLSLNRIGIFTKMTGPQK